jgi:hypothetical protein
MCAASNPTVWNPAHGGLTLARHRTGMEVAAGPVHEKGVAVRGPTIDGSSNTPSSYDLVPDCRGHGYTGSPLD